jgi:5-methylcytosine-specific restriction endonuclease McrA
MEGTKRRCPETGKRHAIEVAICEGKQIEPRDLCSACRERLLRLLDNAQFLEALDRWMMKRLLARADAIAEARLASYSVRRSRANKATARLRDAVLERDGHVCGICNASVGSEDVSIDHIIPAASGGTDELDNLQVAHLVCNSRKGAQ